MTRAAAPQCEHDDWATSLAPLDADPRFPSDERIADLRAHHDTLHTRTQTIHGAHMCDASKDKPWSVGRAALVHVLIVVVLIACAFVAVWGSLAVREH